MVSIVSYIAGIINNAVNQHSWPPELSAPQAASCASNSMLAPLVAFTGGAPAKSWRKATSAALPFALEFAAVAGVAGVAIVAGVTSGVAG